MSRFGRRGTCGCFLAGSMRSEDMERERERRRWEESARREHSEEDLAQARRDERVEVRLHPCQRSGLGLQAAARY
jgi:hypothetical protein